MAAALHRVAHSAAFTVYLGDEPIACVVALGEVRSQVDRVEELMSALAQSIGDEEWQPRDYDDA